MGQQTPLIELSGDEYEVVIGIIGETVVRRWCCSASYRPTCRSRLSSLRASVLMAMRTLPARSWRSF